MSDRIVGISVLDRTDKPERLYVRCQCADGRVLSTSIPVYREGDPKALAHQWRYREVGDTLHVTPSLHWVGVFHNEGQWQTRFVLFDEANYKGHPMLQLSEVNAPQPAHPGHD